MRKQDRKPGVYETEWGNAAEVLSWSDPMAWDLDMGVEIPIECVTGMFLRDLNG